MTDAGAPVLVVGDVAGGELQACFDRPRDLVRLELTGVASASQNARVLLLADGLPHEELRGLLASVREAAPTVRLLAVSLDLSARPDAVDADASFELPADADRLRSALAQPERRAWPPWSPFGDLAAGAAGLAIMLAVWASVVASGLVPPFLVPSPLAVASAFVADFRQNLVDLAITASEAAIGFAIGNLAGIVCAVLLFPSRRIQAATIPTLSALQALPIVSVAPLLSLWLGTGVASKIAMAAIVCFFPIVANLLAGFSGVDRDLVEFFRFHRASYPTCLRLLLFPASAGAIISGLRTSGSLAVVGALVAEFTGADQGLGYRILTANYRFETDRLFVAMLLSGMLGLVFAAAPSLVARVWRRSGADMSGARA